MTIIIKNKTPVLALSFLTILSFMGLGEKAQASSTSASTQASATLSGSCVVNAPDVSFGAYDSASSSATTTSQTIAVQCTKGTAYTLFTVIQPASWTLYQGSPVGIMTNTTGDNLYFQVYIPSANVWANDNNYNTSYHLTSTGTGANQNFNMTYRILPNQFITPGNYSVTETAYVNF